MVVVVSIAGDTRDGGKIVNVCVGVREEPAGSEDLIQQSNIDVEKRYNFASSMQLKPSPSH